LVLRSRPAPKGSGSGPACRCWRSGVVKTYEALNIAYSESKDREIECLEIIQRAWREDNFSYKGKFHDIQDLTVVPQPVQQPTPEIRVAAVSVETFPAAGKAGQGLFLSVRHEDVRMFKQHIDVYRKPGPTPDIPGRHLSISVAPVLSPKPMRRPRKPTGRR
jgi:alkanesulfonate monooxygenase SsuD/methylene tetrahydromethanopterin reductase-like flavin-dependent oxidoreductase (luciferase family)